MKWIAYIPESGNWDISYTGNNARIARQAFSHVMCGAFGYKRLPAGTKVFKDPNQ